MGNLLALMILCYFKTMFTSIYFYRVPNEKIDQFLMIQKKSAEIYRRYGAIDDWTFGPEDLAGKYGCGSFVKEISLSTGESLFFSLSLFESKEDHDRIMTNIGKAPEINCLFDQICQTIDVSKVIRGEFNRLA